MKRRKESLSTDFELYFSKNYAAVVGDGSVGFVSNFLHRKMEKLNGSHPGENILEVGAGQSQHRRFVSNLFESYVELDLRPTENLTPVTPGVKRIIGDCSKLEQFNESSFDRLIATCLLVHLSDPEIALNEWRRVVNHGGSISIWVALEPSLFLRFMQRLTTKRRVEKLGFNYYAMHYRDHIVFYLRLREILLSVFERDKIKIYRFPFRILPWNFNLVQLWTIKINKSER